MGIVPIMATQLHSSLYRHHSLDHDITGLAKCPLEKQTHSHWPVETLLRWLEISAHRKKSSEIQPSVIHKANYN